MIRARSLGWIFLVAVFMPTLMTLAFGVDNRIIVQEIKVNQDPDVYCTPQSETFIAADPTDPQRILVAAHHPTIFGLQSLGLYFSADGGQTWEGAVVLAESLDPQRPILNWAADPSVASDHEGNFYVGILGLSGSIANDKSSPISIRRGVSGVYVARLPKKQKGKPFFKVGDVMPGAEQEVQPKGIRFTAVSRAGPGQTVDDKVLIAADRYIASRFKGRVYVVWTRFEKKASSAGYRNRILFSYSADSGATFSEPKTVVAGTDKEWPHAAFPVVAANGDFYVFWFTFDEIPKDENTPFAGSIYFTKSRDGGLTFGQPRLIRKLVSPPRRLAPTGIKVNGYPYAASSPTDSQFLAVAWSEYATGDADVYLAVTTNGGLTWSSPVRINTDPASNKKDQFFPTVAIDETGTVWAAWIDRRLYENGYYDVFGVYGEVIREEGEEEGTLRLAENFRITSASSLLGNFCHSSRFIGDYNGAVAVGRTFMPVWADGRRNQLDVFMAKITRP